MFIGNQAFDDGDLRGVIQTKEAAWYRFFTTDDTYDPDRLAFDQELLRRYYLARGYADFNVRSAIAELTPDGTSFVITFTVDEGEPYDFGAIDLDSRLRDLEPEQLRELIQTETGDIYNADQIEDSIIALTEEIGKLGYAFVEIEPVPTKHEDERTSSTSPTRSTRAPGSTSSGSTSSATCAPWTRSSGASSGSPKATPSIPRCCAARASASRTSASSRRSR